MGNPQTRILAALLLTLAAGTTSADYIAGAVHNSTGAPEGGVWVIAQTNDLPTPMRKIVVTDDDGRFVIPELPLAKYQLWVRGYGLKDSARVASSADQHDVALSVRVAEDAFEAAQVYPASAWLSLFAPPPATAFGAGQGAVEGGIFGGKAQTASSALENSAGWTSQFKLNCMLCHQVGSAATRLSSGAAYDHGFLKAAAVNYFADALGRKRLVAALDNWAQRIGAGETPTAPARPQGIERNVVITEWEWGDGTTYAHDEIATDKRDPTINANGPVYGVDLANDYLLTLDPMMDVAGRVWMTTQIRRQWASDAPTYCRDDPVIINNRHHRQLGYYDPAHKNFELIDSCFGTHHLQFGPDGRLWTSGDDYVIGWRDPAKYKAADLTSQQRAEGYSEVRIDSDGDGKADRPLVGFHYGVIAHPHDGSAWSAIAPGVSSPPGEAGWILRFDPATKVHEAYSPPAPGMGPRGVDVDSQGVIWTALGGSSHIARFDRSQCKHTAGTGAQCPRGWTLMAVLITRTPAGMAAGCGLLTVSIRSSIPSCNAPTRASCNFAPIHWRTKRRPLPRYLRSSA